MASKKKYTIEYLKELFSQHDCNLLNDTYEGVYSRARFICNIHPDEGVQEISFSTAIYGGTFCKKCGYERSSKKQLQNISIEQLKQEFADKGLELLDNEYKGVKAKYRCRCLIHTDHYFEVVYDNIKNKRSLGCDICRSELYSQRKQTSEEVIKHKVESLGLIYHHVEYTGRYNQGTLIYYICPKHREQGILCKKLSKLNIGQGCPYCNKSHGERSIEDYLKKKHIHFTPQKSYEGLVGVGGLPLTYDFYIPAIDTLIEYQGIQHEKPVDLFQKYKDQFAIQQEHDKRKRKYAKHNNINLIEVWYKDFERIPEILDESLGGVANGS